MLLRKDIDPRCAYCAHGRPLGEEEIICLKKGIVSPAFHCRAFRYDPFRRTPPKPVQLARNYDDQDLSFDDPKR